MVVLMFLDENGSYFWHNNALVTYPDAVATCHSQRGVLAVVDNLDLTERLRQTL